MAVAAVVSALGGCHVVFELEGGELGDPVDAALVDIVCTDETLVLCLTFDDDPSDARIDDRSGTDNPATVPVNLPIIERGGGKAIEVDPNHIVSVAQHPSLDLTGPMTLDMWFGHAKTPTLYAGLIDNDAQYGIVLRSDLRVSCSVSIANVSYTATSSSPVTRTWQHVACVRRGAFLELFVDGIMVDSAPLPLGPTATAGNQPVYIGRDGDTATNTWIHPLSGRIDDVRIFARDLQAAEIKAYFDATK